MRAKTLFASTRATLVKELGIEGGSLFVTEASEILEAREWEERDMEKGTGVDEEALLTREERELRGVKRAEEEERHGTKGRDLMGSGSGSLEGEGGVGVGVVWEWR